MKVALCLVTQHPPPKKKIVHGFPLLHRNEVAGACRRNGRGAKWRQPVEFSPHGNCSYTPPPAYGTPKIGDTERMRPAMSRRRRAGVIIIRARRRSSNRSAHPVSSRYVYPPSSTTLRSPPRRTTRPSEPPPWFAHLPSTKETNARNASAAHRKSRLRVRRSRVATRFGKRRCTLRRRQWSPPRLLLKRVRVYDYIISISRPAGITKQP